MKEYYAKFMILINGLVIQELIIYCALITRFC